MVIGKTCWKSERPRVDHEGLHRLHAGFNGQAQPQIIIHRRLESIAGLAHRLVEFGLDVFFDRDSSSHIMMIVNEHHDVNRRCCADRTKEGFDSVSDPCSSVFIGGRYSGAEAALKVSRDKMDGPRMNTDEHG